MSALTCGEFAKGGGQLPGGDFHAYWRNIGDLPDPDNRAYVQQVIADDVEAYKRLGYRVELKPFDDGENIDLFVRHKRTPNHSDIALLEGAVRQTLARAGWGGSR